MIFMTASNMREAVYGEIVDGSESLYRVVKRSRPDCMTNTRSVSPALFKVWSFFISLETNICAIVRREDPGLRIICC